MNDINGNKLWIRATEEKILSTWVDKKEKKISIRDSVKIQADGSLCYRLWNTDLVIKKGDNIYINISGNMDEIDRYYHPNLHYNFYPRREYIISNTTKSRLNAFLDYYGFNLLEVHSSKKDWSVKYNGVELEVDRLYKLDFTTKTLVMVK